MADLVVRVYDVRFGDAVLVTIPERVNGKRVKRNILFDFGNALSTAGGNDEQRHKNHREQGKAPVEGNHQGEGAGQSNHVADELAEGVTDHALDRAHVVVDP